MVVEILALEVVAREQSAAPACLQCSLVKYVSKYLFYVEYHYILLVVFLVYIDILSKSESSKKRIIFNCSKPIESNTLNWMFTGSW